MKKSIFVFASEILLVLLCGFISCQKNNRSQSENPPGMIHAYNLEKTTVTLFPDSAHPQKGLLIRCRNENGIPKGGTVLFLLFHKSLLNVLGTESVKISFEKMGCDANDIWDFNPKYIRFAEDCPICVVDFTSHLMNVHQILPCGYSEDFMLYDDLLQSEKVQTDVLHYLNADVQDQRACINSLKTLIDQEMQHYRGINR